MASSRAPSGKPALCPGERCHQRWGLACLWSSAPERASSPFSAEVGPPRNGRGVVEDRHWAQMPLAHTPFCPAQCPGPWAVIQIPWLCLLLLLSRCPWLEEKHATCSPLPRNTLLTQPKPTSQLRGEQRPYFVGVGCVGAAGLASGPLCSNLCFCQT